MKKIMKKRLFFTLIFSIISSVFLIVHGVFFDLDFSQISRLSVGGFLFTFIITFIAIISLEKLFNLEDDVEIIKIKKRIDILERKVKK